VNDDERARLEAHAARWGMRTATETYQDNSQLEQYEDLPGHLPQVASQALFALRGTINPRPGNELMIVTYAFFASLDSRVAPTVDEIRKAHHDLVTVSIAHLKEFGWPPEGSEAMLTGLVIDYGWESEESAEA
jgi:hypothetical protein